LVCFFAYRKYWRQKTVRVDFFADAQKELSLYKERMEKKPEKVEIHMIYNSLISIFKQAFLRYQHIDFFNKTGTDLQKALQQRGFDNQELYDFLNAAEQARFSKHAAFDQAIPHIEYMQRFLTTIVQNKATKLK